MDVRSLQTDGFVSIKRPPGLQTDVENAMTAWRRFCALPMEEKQKLTGGDRIDDFGWMYRDDGGPKADRKELFHLLLQRERELHAQARTVSDPRAVEFISSGDALILAIRGLILEFAQSMEETYQMPGFTKEVKDSAHLWTFRFLHYFGGEILANPHADRLGFTLHLTEDDGGGEYFSLDTREWKPWPVDHTQTIIFPSIGLQHRSRCQVKALWHRVVPTERSRTDGRYAMVAFIDFPQIREWDKYKYPRVQAFPPGFNYDMSFAQLDAHFTEPRKVA